MKLKNLFETEYGNNVDLSNVDLFKLPTDLPDVINGNFYCYNNKLTSLKFCPSEVGGTFDCADNKLTSLEHCPSEVGGDFFCSFNRLTSLEHCPSEVGGDFFCTRNKLTSLKDIHEQIKKIDGDFYCDGNPIKSHILGLIFVKIDGDIITKLGDGNDVDKILNIWKNQGRKGVLGCQRELIDAGYRDLAQL